MKILSQPVRFGKTYQSILYSAKTGAVIICSTEHEALRVFDQSKRMGVTIPKPLSYRLQGLNRPVIVDNSDWVMRQFLGKDVEAFTVSVPPSEINLERSGTDKQQINGDADPKS